ncbi:MAG TPA: cytochrome P450 [Longimicrobium sp.]|jgi:pimeloyl-[acyl-carrier protein] synthase
MSGIHPGGPRPHAAEATNCGRTTAAACPITLKRLVESYTEPHGLYDELRARDRVTFDPAGRCWLVTGHAAVRQVLGDARFVSDEALAAPRSRRAAARSFVADAIQRQVIFADGPRQARVQRAVLVELARRSDSLLAPLRDSAVALAERARARGEVDLVGEFAVPYSMEAISMILGLPASTPGEAERLERWSTTYADLTSGYLRMEMHEIVQLGEYFRAQVSARGGTPSDDLIGAFLRDGGLEHEEEVVIQCMMAFSAGRVTTQKLLGDGIPLLLPEWGMWRERLRGNAGFARRLADELLRVVTPTRFVVRYAAEDVVLDVEPGGGHTVRRGEKVVLFLQAGNRDPQAFPDPHALDAERQPNPHLSFGFGAHRCPGASVARIEIQTALQALLETLAELRPHPSAAPSWDPNPNIGGYSSYRCLCA